MGRRAKDARFPSDERGVRRPREDGLVDLDRVLGRRLSLPVSVREQVLDTLVGG